MDTHTGIAFNSNNYNIFFKELHTDFQNKNMQTRFFAWI